MSLSIVSYPTGVFAGIHVANTKKSMTRSQAEKAARQQARREGFRVLDTASVVDQGEGHAWLVELKVEPRTPAGGRHV